ncbi:MAG: carotenoid oxygenase [Ilumatobacteraceae bacterium]|nr:carotenoid oxygenase [Ilumatobacteraceae bacterium]
MAPTHEPPITNLAVRGTLPAGLNGRLLCIGPDHGVAHSDTRIGSAAEGVVHSIHLSAGRVLSYTSRRVITDAVARRLGLNPSPGPRGEGPDVIADWIVVVGGSVLALGNDSLAYELSSDLDTLRRVDLAGQCRGLAATPQRDPITGDLHILANDASEQPVHVVVSARAFTRISRPISGPPTKITALAITRDRVVFVTDGFVGVSALTGHADPGWTATGINAPTLVHAHDAGDAVIVYTLTPRLERWTIHTVPASVHREVLDPTHHHFARTDAHSGGVPPRCLWTTSDNGAHRHDLVTANSDDHIFGPGCRPGDVVFVTDATQTDDNSGWIIGLVHHEQTMHTDVVVLDAANFAQPAPCTIRIPRSVPRGSRSTWIPDPAINHNEGDRP